MLPPDAVMTDPELMLGFAHDRAPGAPHGMPAAVVRPTTAEQVQLVVRACLRTDTAVVARGAAAGWPGERTRWPVASW